MPTFTFFSWRMRLQSLCVVLALATPAFAQNAFPTNSGAAPSEESATESLQNRTESSGQPDQCAAAEQHEFGIRVFQPYAGRVEHSASHTGTHQRELEPDYPDYSADCVAALSQPEHWR